MVTLAELYRRHGGGAPADLLSVDVEGWDLEVLEGNDWTALRPRLVLCEVLPETQEPIDALMRRQRYTLVKEPGGNRFCERCDLPAGGRP